METSKLIKAERWYCPEVAVEVDVRGTQAVCAASHGCRKRSLGCPLYLHFFLKTSAWYLRPCD